MPHGTIAAQMMKTSDSLRTQPPSLGGSASAFAKAMADKSRHPPYVPLGGVILARASRRGKARRFLALFATFQGGSRHAHHRSSRPADARVVGFRNRPGVG